MNRGRKALATIGAVMAVGMVAASPAAADAFDANRVSVTGTYTGQLAGTNQLLVEYACEAQATGAVVSVAITRCGIYNNYPLALPGAVAASAGVETVPLAPFRLCFAATATYLNSTTKSASGCTVTLGAASMLGGTGAAVSA